MTGFLFRWRWTAAYTALILTTVTLVRTVTEALRTQGLVWVVHYGAIVIGGLVGAVILNAFVKKARGRWVSLGVLAFVAVVYAVFMRTLATYPVERIHLLQYGLLGFLVFRSFGPGTEGLRRYAYSAVVVFVIGFADEIIQGFVPTRYFDMKDVFVNLASGALGLALTAASLFNGRCRDLFPRGPRQGKTDLAALAVLGAVVFGVVAIHDLDVALHDLEGAWNGDYPFGQEALLVFDGRGTVTIEHYDGITAAADYYFSGNVLDGPILNIVFFDACHFNPWGRGVGSSFRKNFALDGTGIVFSGHADQPLERISAEAIDPDQP